MKIISILLDLGCPPWLLRKVDRVVFAYEAHRRTAWKQRYQTGASYGEHRVVVRLDPVKINGYSRPDRPIEIAARMAERDGVRMTIPEAAELAGNLQRLLVDAGWPNHHEAPPIYSGKWMMR